MMHKTNEAFKIMGGGGYVLVVYVRGVCVLGGICPGGKCPEGYMSRGKCPGLHVHGSLVLSPFRL